MAFLPVDLPLALRLWPRGTHCKFHVPNWSGRGHVTSKKRGGQAKHKLNTVRPLMPEPTLLTYSSAFRKSM